MKFKKALAVILAVAMVITLMPSMAFASTTNTVNKVPTVSADSAMPQQTVITLNVDDNTWDAHEKQRIKLTLNNATWVTNPALGQQASPSTAAIVTDDTHKNNIITVAYSSGTSISASAITASDNTLEFWFENDGRAKKDEYVTLTFAAGTIKAGSDAGDVSITIDGLDSQVTSKEVTIATIAKGKTVTTVTGDVKTFPRGTVTAGAIGTSIEIRESSANSLATGSKQTFRLTLPKGVSFDTTNSNWSFSGDLVCLTSVAGSSTVPAINYVSDSVADVTVYVTSTALSTERNVLIVKPSIVISKNAAEGDITVQVTGKTGNIADASDLVIAKYGNESVTVSTSSDVPTIYAGYLQNKKDKNFTVEVTLKESMVNSLSSGRYVDFEFPEEVQIKGPIQAKVGSGDKKDVLAKFVEIGDGTYTQGAITASGSAIDASTFSFIVPDDSDNVTSGANAWSPSKANTITFTIPVTVKANYTGDVTLKVSGAKAGVDETELVVAKVESPITVTTSTTEVKNGIQKQAVSNITITENVAGYLGKTASSELTLTLDNLGLTNSLVFDDATVEVTAGDLEISKSKVSAGVITIPIKSASTKVSTIEITGITASLNRTLPEGGYDLKVGGSALVENSAYDDKDFAVAAVKVADYLKIVTPADSTTVETKIDSQFVIGQSSYTNNGEAAEMDAAPYIDSNNRTMVPIRYIANACGVSDDNITWDQATQTATLNGTNTVVTIKVGSNTIQTSTGTITMDTVAVNNNGRIYVPARFIANALGANVTWDAATKTVGISK